MIVVRLIKKIALLVLIVFVGACATPTTYIDYDKDANFDKYVSYNFYAPDTVLDEVEEEAIMDFIEENLQNKGLESKVIAKFSIDFFVEFFEAENPVNFNMGYATSSSTSAYMTITISFADALTSELFWQGVVERKIPRNISEEKRLELYEEFVALALNQYPPKAEETDESEEKPSTKRDTNETDNSSEKVSNE